jgi:hypothetical protein
MRELCTDALIEGAQHALSTPVLCRSVGAGHAERNAVAVKERASVVIVELAAIISLQCKHGEGEVRSNHGVEATDCSKSVRFEAEWESPGEMTIIIKDEQVITKT